MHYDEPGDEVHDLFTGAIFGGHPLGRLISGTEATVSPMTRTQVNRFYRRRYTAPQIIITAAGNLEHATVVRLVRAAHGIGRLLLVEALGGSRMAGTVGLAHNGDLGPSPRHCEEPKATWQSSWIASLRSQ